MGHQHNHSKSGASSSDKLGLLVRTIQQALPCATTTHSVNSFQVQSNIVCFEVSRHDLLDAQSISILQGGPILGTLLSKAQRVEHLEHSFKDDSWGQREPRSTGPPLYLMEYCCLHHASARPLIRSSKDPKWSEPLYDSRSISFVSGLSPRRGTSAATAIPKSRGYSADLASAALLPALDPHIENTDPPKVFICNWFI